MHLAHYHYSKKYKTKLEAMGEGSSLLQTTKHRSLSVTEMSVMLYASSSRHQHIPQLKTKRKVNIQRSKIKPT